MAFLDKTSHSYIDYYYSCNTQCTPTSWLPDASTQCSGVKFFQTSNCGVTREATGTKDCGTGGGKCYFVNMNAQPIREQYGFCMSVPRADCSSTYNGQTLYSSESECENHICPSGLDYCSDTTCKVDCGGIGKTNYTWWIIGGIGLLLLIVIVKKK